MQLQNPFPYEVRLLYLYVFACFQCGRSNGGIELHHIWGRISGSALNACPLCKTCHNKISHNLNEHLRLFQINMNFLIDENYKLVERDNLFLELVKKDLQHLNGAV